MITKKDYLKNLNTMTTDEKMLLIDRTEKWLEAYPALRASVTSWEDAPVKDFDEGLILCSCLRRAHSFLDNAYGFNAKKCLDLIQETLKEIVRIARPGGPRTESEKKKKPIKAFVPKRQMPDEDGKVNALTENERIRLEQDTMADEAKNDRFRPQNLESYIHLLPKELQQECKNVQKKYYMPMREYRSRLESLTENPDATQEQRAEMAAYLVAAEEALAAFWEKVDKEYKKVTGQELPTESGKEKKLSEYTKEDIDKLDDEETKEKLKFSRVENNKKYLRRGDLPDCEETREQLAIRAREMQEWGVPLTKRHIANMQKYGVTVIEITVPAVNSNVEESDNEDKTTQKEHAAENEGISSNIEDTLKNEPKMLFDKEEQ